MKNIGEFFGAIPTDFPKTRGTPSFPSLKRPQHRSSPHPGPPPILSDVAFSPPLVKAVQPAKGTRALYERIEEHAPWSDHITQKLADFIAAQTSICLGTASAGSPYIRHRGGPPGFLNVLSERRIAFAGLVGHRQNITLGNLSEHLHGPSLLGDRAVAPTWSGRHWREAHPKARGYGTRKRARSWSASAAQRITLGPNPGSGNGDSPRNAETPVIYNRQVVLCLGKLRNGPIKHLLLQPAKE